RGPASRVATDRRRPLLIDAQRAATYDEPIRVGLYAWEGMTAPELSQSYDMGVPAVRGRLRRAKQAFERALAELSDDEEQWRGTLSAFEAGSWVDEIREHLGELRPVRRKRPPADE